MMMRKQNRQIFQAPTLKYKVSTPKSKTLTLKSKILTLKSKILISKPKVSTLKPNEKKHIFVLRCRYRLFYHMIQFGHSPPRLDWTF
ncbi:hypothetical protein BGZ72_007581 [Mortierella alpina]|nr:hypothetical protein BGZ72_007581 [Mortierella alpina]